MNSNHTVLITGATGYVGGRFAYWYGVWPLHQIVFAGMLRGIARSAEKRA